MEEEVPKNTSYLTLDKAWEPKETGCEGITHPQDVRLCGISFFPSYQGLNPLE
jgi:hypothetical protein